MYDAAAGAGARLNGRPLRRVTPVGRQAPLIPAPGAVHQELQAAGLHYERGPAYPSLAYRLVQVASGRLDAAVARRGAQDWDVAGAAAILNEAGVELADVCEGALRLNRQEVRHGALAALAEPSLKPVLHAALIKVYGCPQADTDVEGQ
jgi:myo-inositol-1(or 4)-monophosphatase